MTAPSSALVPEAWDPAEAERFRTWLVGRWETDSAALARTAEERDLARSVEMLRAMTYAADGGLELEVAMGAAGPLRWHLRGAHGSVALVEWRDAAGNVQDVVTLMRLVLTDALVMAPWSGPPLVFRRE